MFYFLALAALARPVLDQVTPDVFLVSSKADDRFIDLCSGSSMDFFFSGRVDICALWYLFRFAVAASGGFFQIRPQKDFRPERGRNNVLSLGLLADLPEEMPDPHDLETPTEPRSAYEFMQRRRNPDGDPTLRRWNASIRMSNFATLDTSPFAVCSMRHFSHLGTSV